MSNHLSTAQLDHCSCYDATLSEDASIATPVPYDECLLERSRTQWQFGDWQSLARLARNTLQHHPDRAKLALLAAAGRLQTGSNAEARQYIRLAQDWGVSKKLICQILISGVHNSIGSAAILADQQQRGLSHFENALRTGSPESEIKLLTQARVETQIGRLKGLPDRIAIQKQHTQNAFCIQNKSIIVRSIHHLSCTGGTLFSKCLAAMPKTLVLNEIDPYSTLAPDAKGNAPFQPCDIISLLQQSNADAATGLIADVFLNNIAIIAANLDDKGQALVLRDHAHSAYLTGENKRKESNLKQLMESQFQLRAVVTVRDPIDSYLSLISMGWVHYTPPTFDEYCKRYIQFIEDHGDLKIFKYEVFVESPQQVMRELADELQIEFSADFVSHFFDFKFSGDSGRSGSVIEPRSRRDFDENFISETKASPNYRTLIELLDYPALC